MAHRQRPGAPVSLSDEARAFLAQLPDYANPTLPGPDDTEGWRAFAAQFDALTSSGYPAEFPHLAITEREVAGVPTYVLHGVDLADPSTAPVYLELHGGGLFLGAGDGTRLGATDVATVNGMVTWAPDYRMIPDHPYPAALDDCLTVYRALLAERAPYDVFVGGTSAGGNLAAALVRRALDEGLPAPAALVLLSPELDLTESGDSFLTMDGVDILTSLRNANLMYAAGRDLADPYLSPLFADVDDFPPTFLQAGTRDMLLSNAARMHAKLYRAGVEVELHVSEGMPHGGFGRTAPEDAALRADVRTFLDRHRRARGGG